VRREIWGGRIEIRLKGRFKSCNLLANEKMEAGKTFRLNDMA